MDLKPPHNFIKISHAFTRHDGKFFDVMGVVSDFLPPTKTRGTDFTMKVSLWDDSCSEMSGVLHNGMDFRFFHSVEAKLPPIKKAGDVIVLRNVKMLNRGSSWVGVTNSTTMWAIIAGSDLLNNVGKAGFNIEYQSYHDASGVRGREPDLAEIEYARAILVKKDPSELRGPPAQTFEMNSTQTQTMQKYRKIEELTPSSYTSNSSFADLFCEIRKIYDSGGSVIELKITDYTENKLLHNNNVENSYDGDEYGHIRSDSNWPGPWGRMSLKIDVWDEHAAFVRDAVRNGNLSLGSYVLFQNVSIKMEKSGSQLQGHCRGGHGNRGGLTIYKPREAGGDQRFKDLLQRKRDYETKAKQANLPFISQLGKIQARDTDHAQSSLNFSDNKTGNKKRNSKNREKREKLRKLSKQIVNARSNGGQNIEEQSEKEPSKNNLTNQHVHCEGINVPLKTVADILDENLLVRTTAEGTEFHLPFQNCKYKSRLRVIDFFPDKLEDFAVPRPISEYEALSDHEDEDCDPASPTFARNYPESVKWIWQFYLLVTDPSTKRVEKQNPIMLLQVADQDGDYLLNAEACDLRANPEELARLKEKLFVMWGDLQEKKGETGITGEELYAENMKISSRPFECFVKEYGVNARDEDGFVLHDEYERMFRMFGTRIC